MSNQPSQNNSSDNARTHHLQSENIPFAIGSAQQLAQFAAAATANYYPKPQSKPDSFVMNSSNSITNNSQPATSTAPASTTTTTVATPTTATTTANSNQPSKSHASASETGQKSSSGLQPPPAQSIDLTTFSGFKFVTLDGLQLETREIYDKISDTFQWEMCESQNDRCVEFIQQKCANKRVFLITSGSLGRIVVPTIHNLPQLYCIYVYCADVPYNQQWACHYSKVRVVCNDDDKYLLPQFAVDVAQANIEWGDAFFKAGKYDEAKKKYSKALENLTQYPKRPDPFMIEEVNNKLSKCK